MKPKWTAKAKATWLSISAAGLLAAALWASAALADEGPRQQRDLEFQGQVHSLQASGGELEIGATFENRSETAARVNLLLEIETDNGDGSVVFQEIAEGELMERGDRHTLVASWAPPGPGDYKLNLGVFSTDWSVAYEWVDAAARITRIDDGAGSEGWLLDAGGSRVHQESRVHQSSTSQVTQSSVARGADSGIEVCGGWDEMVEGHTCLDEEARERVQRAIERAEEARRMAEELRDKALGR